MSTIMSAKFGYWVLQTRLPCTLANILQNMLTKNYSEHEYTFIIINYDVSER